MKLHVAGIAEQNVMQGRTLDKGTKDKCSNKLRTDKTMGAIGWSEMSIWDYHSTLRKISDLMYIATEA